MVVELEHLKTKTRLIDEKFASVRGNTGKVLNTSNESINVVYY